MKKLLYYLMALATLTFISCEKGDNLDDIYDPNNPLAKIKCKNNEILYTTETSSALNLRENIDWGVNLVSNTYENGIGRLTFDADITKIPAMAFGSNKDITYVKLPNTITEIGYEGFDRCSKLKSINIPNSVTKIGADAFWTCESLMSVTIGNNVTSIGKEAFLQCKSLITVYCKPTTPPELRGGAWTFKRVATDFKIYVPKNSISEYLASNWGQFRIIEYDF